MHSKKSSREEEKNHIVRIPALAAFSKAGGCRIFSKTSRKILT
jgi:hypothetical protein